jgi:uncharacterized membrane protein
MTSISLIFILSSIGISETVYLIRSRKKKEEPICPLNGDCAAVLESKYNKIFLIPNDILGLMFYIAVSLLSSFVVIGLPPIHWWVFIIKLSVIIGSLFSLFLTYLQLYIIRSWCSWCLLSAFTIWLMEVIIIISKTI